MKTVRSAVVLLLLLASGCNQSKSSDQPPPPPKAVIDSAPYLCDLIPEQSLRQVIGFAAPLEVHWSGPQTDNGLCLTRATGQEAPLGVVWSYNNGERIIKTHQDGWRGKPAQPMPKDLGVGLATVAETAGGNPRPNYAIALFRCGKRKPYISIDFAPVVRGRDAVQDMIAFMRIAEKRFGQIHKCTPKPA